MKKARKKRRPKSRIEVPCKGGNYYDIQLNDCTIGGLKKLEKRVKAYLAYAYLEQEKR
jgi:hypothetical protein